MGTVVDYSCECGLSATLYFGFGMLDVGYLGLPPVNRVAAFCADCSEMFAAPAGEPPECPTCLRPEREFLRTLTCPRCKERTLRIGSVGMWD